MTPSEYLPFIVIQPITRRTSIFDVPKCGIAVSDDHLNTKFSNVTISGNDIYDFNQLIRDGGAFYVDGQNYQQSTGTC